MYSFVELFAGVGGFRKGLESSSKFQCFFANDIDAQCKKTYDLNYSEPKLTLGSIENLENLPKADLVVGGFPCQSFSVAGKREGFNDPRGNLFFLLMNLVDEIQPSMILFENVKNLVTHDSGKTFETILERIKESGYHVKYEVCNTSLLTPLPQNRERVYIFGHKKKEVIDNFNWPSPVTERLTIRQILDDEVPDRYYYDSRFKVFPIIEEGIKEEYQVYQFRRHYLRKNAQNLVPTLTANMGSGGHNVPLLRDEKGIRKLTPRETFRLQGMGEYLLPEMSDSDLYHQAGNAVTATLVCRIGESILEALEMAELEKRVSKVKIRIVE